MSTPPEMMGASPPGAAAGGEPSPGAAPTMTPQDNKGEQASADAQVEVAIRFLEQALVAHGSGSPKGKELFKAIGSLRKAFKFDDAANEVVPAELKTALMAPAGGAGGGGTPEGPGAAGAGAAAPPQAMAA
jgi:hypothetical protein